VGLAGRSGAIAELAVVLERAVAGSGGLVGVVGPPGSGKTALLAVAAARAQEIGLDVVTVAPVQGRPGRSVWAQLVGELGGSDEVVASLLNDAGEPAADAAMRQLVAGPGRLIIVDDVDTGGPDALAMLPLLTARLVASSTAVMVAARSALGLMHEVQLGGLSESDLSQLMAELPDERRHAVWMASRGLPGPAQLLALQVRDLPAGRDALVHLALQAQPATEFLQVDDRLVELLESALGRAEDPGVRARLLARLARELLGDPLTGPRRRLLADEALLLARGAADVPTLVDVLEARLHALWDPAGAQDRLAAAAEITDLARAAGDARGIRDGLFWRFIALMELARVDEAEQTLVSFERLAAAAGDGEATVMALSRHAMLATLRGRFAAALTLADEVAERARRIGLPDAERLVGAVRGMVTVDVGDERDAHRGLATMYALARRFPGHFYEATAARILAGLGRTAEATAELQQLVPRVLAASGPRWLGVATDLAEAAVDVDDDGAAQQLYEALLPYQGRLVVWGGANAVSGPASHFLGRLATQLRLSQEAVEHLDDAVALCERIGALPALARSLAALSDALALRGTAGDDELAAGARARARELSEALGMTRLIALMGPAPEQWALWRDGDGWLLSAGPERARIVDSRGMEQRRALLATPGREISALDLAAGGPGLQAAATQPVLDAAAAASYRERLSVLDAQLDAADAAADDERAARVEAERQAVLDELRRATGLGGRVRRATDEAERARVNVTRTLRAALERITVAAPRAGAHLQASVRTGLACRYDPQQDPRNSGPPAWRV
jgi:tetratricopeptide (TPR) repeat protein